MGIALNGAARVHGKRQCQAPAFTAAELEQAIHGLGLATTTGLRDRALLLGLCRRVSLLGIGGPERDVEDVELTRLELVIHLRRSKANQHGEGEDKVVFYAA